MVLLWTQADATWDMPHGPLAPSALLRTANDSPAFLGPFWVSFDTELRLESKPHICSTRARGLLHEPKLAIHMYHVIAQRLIKRAHFNIRGPRRAPRITQCEDTRARAVFCRDGGGLKVKPTAVNTGLSIVSFSPTRSVRRLTTFGTGRP